MKADREARDARKRFDGERAVRRDRRTGRPQNHPAFERHQQVRRGGRAHEHEQAPRVAANEIEHLPFDGSGEARHVALTQRRPQRVVDAAEERLEVRAPSEHHRDREHRESGGTNRKRAEDTEPQRRQRQADQCAALLRRRR